jgi:hypothetical protein
MHSKTFPTNISPHIFPALPTEEFVSESQKIFLCQLEKWHFILKMNENTVYIATIFNFFDYFK